MWGLHGSVFFFMPPVAFMCLVFHLLFCHALLLCLSCFIRYMSAAFWDQLILQCECKGICMQVYKRPVPRSNMLTWCRMHAGCCFGPPSQFVKHNGNAKKNLVSKPLKYLTNIWDYFKCYFVDFNCIFLRIRTKISPKRQQLLCWLVPLSCNTVSFLPMSTHQSPSLALGGKRSLCYIDLFQCFCYRHSVKSRSYLITPFICHTVPNYNR